MYYEGWTVGALLKIMLSQFHCLNVLRKISNTLKYKSINISYYMIYWIIFQNFKGKHWRLYFSLILAEYTSWNSSTSHYFPEVKEIEFRFYFLVRYAPIPFIFSVKFTKVWAHHPLSACNTLGKNYLNFLKKKYLFHIFANMMYEILSKVEFPRPCTVGKGSKNVFNFLQNFYFSDILDFFKIRECF